MNHNQECINVCIQIIPRLGPTPAHNTILSSKGHCRSPLSLQLSHEKICWEGNTPSYQMFSGMFLIHLHC
jgi:hypothetical protein